jgi:hypothetical protein
VFTLLLLSLNSFLLIFLENMTNVINKAFNSSLRWLWRFSHAFFIALSHANCLSRIPWTFLFILCSIIFLRIIIRLSVSIVNLHSSKWPKLACSSTVNCCILFVWSKSLLYIIWITSSILNWFNLWNRLVRVIIWQNIRIFKLRVGYSVHLFLIWFVRYLALTLIGVYLLSICKTLTIWSKFSSESHAIIIYKV